MHIDIIEPEDIDYRICNKCKKVFIVDLEEEKKLGYKINWCSNRCKAKFYLGKCNKCHQEFYSYPKSYYCSEECKIDICSVCGKSFIRKGKETFCSEDCRTKKYTHICLSCGKEFYKAQPIAKYCSTVCRKTNKLVKKKYNVCKKCKKIITSFDGTKKNFCSEECKEAYVNKPKSKSKNNSFITNDELHNIIKARVNILLNNRKEAEKKYNVCNLDYNLINGFTQSLKNRIRDRENHCCYICEDDKSLEVHHIISRRLGGNHDDNNLVTLCTKCHRYLETGNDVYAIRKCYEKAKHTFGMFGTKLMERLSKKEELTEIQIELESIYENMIALNNYEMEELLIKMSDLIDIIDKFKNITK